jgi:hypothetical protein
MIELCLALCFGLTAWNMLREPTRAERLRQAQIRDRIERGMSKALSEIEAETVNSGYEFICEVPQEESRSVAADLSNSGDFEAIKILVDLDENTRIYGRKNERNRN